jgi:hypothetical protein
MARIQLKIWQEYGENMKRIHEKSGVWVYDRKRH